MKRKSISNKQSLDNTSNKKTIKKDDMDIYTEKIPGYNLSIFSWFKLTSLDFSDDFLKCIEKLKNPEEFVRRMLHVKLNKSEVEDLDHLACTILSENFPVTYIVEEFEDIIFTRTKTRTMVFLAIGRKYEKIIRDLIPYGITYMPGKKGALLELDWEGNSYFRKYAKSNKCGPVDQFTKKVLKLASKK